jgi:succinyl-diaminopimelate desuccinylase
MNWMQFGEKLQLALESSHDADPDGGVAGIEVEFNIVDSGLRPLVSAPGGWEDGAFSDWLLAERIPAAARDRFQLEVFSWMTEVATAPYWSVRAAVSEARALEAVLLNALADVGQDIGEELWALHGNLLALPFLEKRAIPAGWNLARRHYLERCVRAYGPALATAGIHTNHSLPEALVSWDFVHLPLSDRRNTTLERFRTEAMIRATRVLRAFCPSFIAVSAASPLVWRELERGPAVVLTDIDSQRLCAFPNPPDLDVADLYSSWDAYLEISRDLVRSGVRFGANNWTPARARSGVDTVRRNVLATAEQLSELYRRGLAQPGEYENLAQAEAAVVVENLVARVDLPMHRVEVRTDEGGDDLELSVAKATLKQLLLYRIYGDPEFGASYVYDAADVQAARTNEDAAARRGLDAEIVDGLSGARCTVRDQLGRALREVAGLADVLGATEDLGPLRDMAAGAPNPAERMRRRLRELLGASPECAPDGAPVVPNELLTQWAGERRAMVAREVADLRSQDFSFDGDRSRLLSVLECLQTQSRRQPSPPVPVRSSRPEPVLEGTDDRTARVLALSMDLVRFPSVTNCADERLDEVDACGRYVAGTLHQAGLEVEHFTGQTYPSVMAGFPGALTAPVTLGGHFDVVQPEPDDRQFVPRIEGDYLWGRGAADMKTVVASYMVWMAERVRRGPPYPPVNLLLVGNEENGETEAWGTPQVLEVLARRDGWSPEFMILGERTGEQGDELFGEVCTENRGVLRMSLVGRSVRGHTGVGGAARDLVDGLIEARRRIGEVCARHLTLTAEDGWVSGARFPFMNVGLPGVYNITADEGRLGLEVRPIPNDDLGALVAEIHGIADDLGLECDVEVNEPGIACPLDNPHLGALMDAVEAISGRRPRPARKKPGTSARFAPGGNAVIWGQTGIGPHSKDERHFIPSIEPYLRMLDAYADRLLGR